MATPQLFKGPTQFWKEEGYDWELGSEAFRIADWMVDNQAFSNATPIVNYSRDYKDERREFDKVYQWVIENLVFDKVTLEFIPDPGGIKEGKGLEAEFQITNGGDTPVHISFTTSQGLQTQHTFTYSFQEELSLGVKTTFKSDWGIAGASWEVNMNLKFQATQTVSDTETKTVNFGTNTSWDIPPRKVSNCTVRVLSRELKGKFKLKTVGRFSANAGKPPTLKMNYGDRFVQPGGVPLDVLTVKRSGTLDASFSISMAVSRGSDEDIGKADPKKVRSYDNFVASLRTAA